MRLWEHAQRAGSKQLQTGTKDPASAEENVTTRDRGAAFDGPANTNLVAALFGRDYDPKTVHIASFPGDPHNKEEAKWHGARLSAPQFATGIPVANNNFVCMGRLDPTTLGRSIRDVTHHVAFWMDDVGTKVPLDRVRAFCQEPGMAPTAIMETSPGNFSYFWRLRTPVEEVPDSFEAETVAAVRAVLKRDGWGDPAAQDSARYMRIEGVNGKKAYRGEDGQPFTTNVFELSPSNDVSLSEFALHIIGPDWAAKVKAGDFKIAHVIASGNNDRAATMDDPLVKLAAVVGLHPQPSTREGVIDCSCPNEAAHTGGDPTGYAIINDGMSYCNHASCQHLKSPDFADMMVDKYDQMIAAGIMFGTHVENPFGGGIVEVATGEVMPSSGTGFLAAARFEGSPLDEEAKQQLANVPPTLHPGVPPWVAKLNDRHAFVLSWDRVVEFDTAGAIVGRHRREAFQIYHDGKEQLSAPNGRLTGMGSAWLRSPYARRYSRTGLWNFGNEPPETLNLWRGLPTQSERKDALIGQTSDLLTPILEFIRDVVASGRAYVSDYVLSWLAYKVQNPLQQTGTVLALVGRQGTGKTKLAEMVTDIFGTGFVVSASSKRHMLGNFNAHFENKVLAVFEEAFFGRDPEVAGSFKDIVTGSLIHIEGKGENIRDVPNMLGILITSNHTSAVPLEPGDRRTTLIRVSNSRRQDVGYFQQLSGIWANGGREEFIKFLLARDLSRFSPRRPLDTPEKAEALGEVGDVVVRFLVNLLDRGIPAGASNQISPKDWHAGPVFMGKHELYADFEVFAHRQSSRHVPGPAEFNRRVGELFPSRKEHRPRLGKTHGAGTRGYLYPALAECRREFQEAAGGVPVSEAA